VVVGERAGVAVNRFVVGRMGGIYFVKFVVDGVVEHFVNHYLVCMDFVYCFADRDIVSRVVNHFVDGEMGVHFVNHFVVSVVLRGVGVYFLNNFVLEGVGVRFVNHLVAGGVGVYCFVDRRFVGKGERSGAGREERFVVNN
jgi:hypothetical protein